MWKGKLRQEHRKGKLRTGIQEENAGVGKLRKDSLEANRLILDTESYIGIGEFLHQTNLNLNCGSALPSQMSA